uniref:Arc family DNA-binding protein n=1 Tax=Caldicellulosiruptor owensensis TaxID=55205 RepID=A0A7C5Z333_9FIRM
MADYKKAYTLRIDETLLDKIRVIAEKNKRSINAQIEYLIQQCVEEFEAKHGEIKIHEEKSG